MQVILFMALSLDGKTTAGTDDVSWVAQTDIERMDAEMQRCGVMIMGSRTYESFGEDLPTGKALQVVMTSQSELLSVKKTNVIFTDDTPSAVLTMLEKKGFTRAMLAGGETLNAAFLSAGLITEIRIIFKPVVLGEGKGLFAQVAKPIKLESKSQTVLIDGSVEISCEV